jgi:hypothetical protein
MESFRFFCLNLKNMKYKKLLSLGVTLMLTLSQLFAQKQSPPLTFKSGDRLETGIRIRNFSRNSDYNLSVRYEVSNKLPNGNLAFKVTIERMRLKYADAENNWWGYDSYYPKYMENRKKNLSKQIYEITTNRNGKISNVTVLSTAQKFNFSLLSVKTNASFQKEAFSSESIFPAVQVKKVSETIISCLISGNAMPKTLQLSASNDIINAIYKSASFTLPTNAVIKGHITNITPIDTIYEFGRKIFKFNKDGSFKADVLTDLTASQMWVMGQFDEYKTFNVYLEPFDTLIVKADRLDFDNTVSFSGNAAAKAGLAKELWPIFNNQWVNESKYRDKTLAEFLIFQQQGLKQFNEVLHKYANRVSTELINDYQANFRITQAGTKLEFFTHNRKGVKPKMTLDGFPINYFVSIDTLPVSMNNSEGGLHYIWYLDWLLSYKQTKLGMMRNNQQGFYTDFATAMASFDGHPLYFTLYNSFREELHKSDLDNTERLKNYYEDFINNCGDTTLTNRIKKLWAQARLWAPGNPSPIKKFFLKDGSTLDLAKFKGKPLVLIVNNNHPDILKGYFDLIEKQKASQIHFVIVQGFASNWDIDQQLKELPNVTYVELSDDRNNQKNFDLYYQQTKVFTFNSDFRVISGYLIDEYGGQVADKAEAHQAMQELIKKAIDSSEMTKEQKASLINTIGWSVGSALLASIGIFLIYRVRLTNLRKKTLLNNRIKGLEIKAIRSQMNPHFMFNALNSIQSLINNHQYKEANVYLEKFALLMRRVLNNSEKSFVTLSDELDAITLYCELEQLRFNFKFEIEVSGEVNTQLTEIPGMIIQPLVENSILHGLAQKGDAGRLTINISCDQRYLKIVIKDNGTGLKENIADGNKSFGLKLLKERLILLSNDGNVGNLDLSSNLGGNESGVTAVLTIPID